MPYAPGVVDQSGAIRAQGILGAFQNFSGGMARYKQQQDENKQLESENKALELITKNAAGTVGLPPELVDQLTSADPNESPRAKNARLKTALTGVLTQQQLQDEQQKQAMQKAQMAQMAAVAQRDVRNQAAAAAAVAPITVPGETRPRTPAEGGFIMRDPNITGPDTMQDPGADEMMRRYLAAGGNDRNQADMLIAAAKPRKEQRTLQTITVKDEQGNPVSFAWDGASAPQRLTKETKPAAPLSGPGKMLADARALEAAGDPENAKLLRSIAQKQSEGKPLNPIEFMMGNNPEYQAYLANFLAKQKDAKAAGAGEPPKFGPEFEGKRVKGPDGKTYIVKNGVPVPL